jgi:multiple sugar transport system ATP-binding protein
MGRDTSIVAEHPAYLGTTIRAIVPSEDVEGISGETVCFNLKPKKVHLFDFETEKTINETGTEA